MNGEIAPSPHPTSRFQFGWVGNILFRPRQAFRTMLQQPGSLWLTPMLVLTLTTLLRVVVAGWLEGKAAALGELQLPLGWEWYTAEQQAQYMQTMQATQGPVFLYVLPAIGNLLAVWLGWLLVGGLLHLVMTLFGGRGTTQTAMHIAAWAGLTWAVRDLVRVIFMLISQRLITSPGISAFAPPGAEGSGLFLAGLLALVDIYLIWHILLIALGVRAGNGIASGKAFLGAGLTVSLVILAWSGLVYLAANLGNLTFNRPFYF